jgi:hypothetical protein
MQPLREGPKDCHIGYLNEHRGPFFHKVAYTKYDDMWL